MRRGGDVWTCVCCCVERPAGVRHAGDGEPRDAARHVQLAADAVRRHAGRGAHDRARPHTDGVRFPLAPRHTVTSVEFDLPRSYVRLSVSSCCVTKALRKGCCANGVAYVKGLLSHTTQADSAPVVALRCIRLRRLQLRSSAALTPCNANSANVGSTERGVSACSQSGHVGVS